MIGTRWLDFSGAPALLIPRSLVPSWRGTTDRASGQQVDYDPHHPVTDYDRACNAAWPGEGLLEVGGGHVIVLYDEDDLHSWDGQRRIAGSGGFWPSDEELKRASWTDSLRWMNIHQDFLLMNSAADGSMALREDDFLPLRLDAGPYVIASACIRSGFFHRFTRTHA